MGYLGIHESTKIIMFYIFSADVSDARTGNSGAIILNTGLAIGNILIDFLLLKHICAAI